MTRPSAAIRIRGCVGGNLSNKAFVPQRYQAHRGLPSALVLFDANVMDREQVLQRGVHRAAIQQYVLPDDKARMLRT